MAWNYGIPLPKSSSNDLFEGVQQYQTNKNNTRTAQIKRDELAQQWQEHLRNAAIREAQEARLRQEFDLNQQLHPLKYKELEAKINSETEKANAIKKFGSQRVSAAIQEADILFDRDDPRHTQYILNKSKQFMPSENQLIQDQKTKSSPDFEKIATYLENAVDMNPMPAASQALYRKQMNEELTQIDKAKQVKHAINQARSIVKDNPDLYRKAINIIANPEATPGMIEKSLTSILPKKDVEAFTGLGKLYADILTKQAQLNGMSRSVYALKLQQQAKAQVKNPDETNEQIFKNIEREIAPSMDREKALLYAMKHNQYLPFTKNYDLGEGGEPNKLPTKVGNPTPMGMMKGIDKEGKEHSVHPSRKQQFEEAGGNIL